MGQKTSRKRLKKGHEYFAERYKVLKKTLLKKQTHKAKKKKKGLKGRPTKL